MNYYTLQILYGSTNEPTTHEFKDMEGVGDNPAAIEQLQQRLYTSGFKVRTSPTTIELISPLRIYRAFLIKQPSKYATS